ncbi:MAG: gamma-glutamylcyclotransferase [Cyanobacteria bacterium P01_A01_bin.84]
MSYKWIKKNHLSPKESSFYYFAYGSCMCPVDLKRTMGEMIHPYFVGIGILPGYRLGFHRYSPTRKCGVLDVVEDKISKVYGVLYQLPWRLSTLLDKREGAPVAYCQKFVDIQVKDHLYQDVRTYVVTNKSKEEFAPDETYFHVVLRGAVTCGLPEEYCWFLFNHMYNLQRRKLIESEKSKTNRFL